VVLQIQEGVASAIKSAKTVSNFLKALQFKTQVEVHCFFKNVWEKYQK